ncbi:hypothetical protein ACTWQL_16480 [Pseudalkalibacillus sp. R45]|uniref:hypothetical protein n=1 Tax=Pseudalkalibacillus sp. R45 TaxID=3457433 RepID=UPI003FCD9C93
MAAFGVMGTFLQNTAAFFAAILSFVLTIVLAIASRGKYYVKTDNSNVPKDEDIA